MTVQIFYTLHGMEMNAWIKAARLHARLTQEQLGEFLGVGKGNVWAWEKGNHEASLNQLVRIAEVTGFKEPLPGTSAKQSAIAAGGADWPFKSIDAEKVGKLPREALAKLERAIVSAAELIDLDIKKE